MQCLRCHRGSVPVRGLGDLELTSNHQLLGLGLLDDYPVRQFLRLEGRPSFDPRVGECDDPAGLSELQHFNW